MSLPSKGLNSLGKFGIRGSRRGIGRKAAENGLKPRPRKRVKSISKLIKEADRLASETVRGLESKTDRTFGRCYTCGKTKLKRHLQGGHFISRRWKAVRWHFDNMRPQCAGCNKFKNGEPQKFRRNLIKEIGKERVEHLEEIFDQEVKLSREYLMNLIEELKKV